MAEFLKDSQLTGEIEKLIDDAEQDLWLISPYIKFHERIKSRLKLKINNPDLHIVVIFGKNEDDVHKSLSKEDFDFLKEFPNITIGYEKRLHAKYFASENYSITTSMNLHEFSHNNNIEVGIKMKSKKWSLNFSGETIDPDAFKYFEEIVQNSEIIFDREPVFKTSFLNKAYIHSEIKTDESDNFFKEIAITSKKFFQRKVTVSVTSDQGFCIRTGKTIPFNPQKPMCLESYESWVKFKNPDYKEKFCHKTGKPSNGKTSMRNPIL